MRALLVLVAVSCGAGLPRSETKRALEVYADGKGNYVAVSFESRQVFFGRGTSFYAVATYAAANPNRLGFLDPRLALPGVIVRRPGGEIAVMCLDKDARLARIPEVDANSLLDEAVFESQQPQSSPLALGVAADGTYTYIDVEGDRRRVFVGAPGRMRQVPVLASDGPLDHFRLETADGVLEVVLGDKPLLSWRATPLTSLDPTASWRLIFDTLRVYPTRTPTPCDIITL